VGSLGQCWIGVQKTAFGDLLNNWNCEGSFGVEESKRTVDLRTDPNLELSNIERSSWEYIEIESKRRQILILIFAPGISMLQAWFLSRSR
jgi:hypothetical protein